MMHAHNIHLQICLFNAFMLRYKMNKMYNQMQHGLRTEFRSSIYAGWCMGLNQTWRHQTISIEFRFAQGRSIFSLFFFLSVCAILQICRIYCCLSVHQLEVSFGFLWENRYPKCCMYREKRTFTFHFCVIVLFFA